jgi:hypothetical protein
MAVQMSHRVSFLSVEPAHMLTIITMFALDRQPLSMSKYKNSRISTNKDQILLHIHLARII